ncbi:hypothetical protein ABPG74_020120 [Tetrahymena malaccensis]
MYFSKGKTQSAQSSMTDLGNPNPTPARPQSAIQKNLFNYNIYFSERNQAQEQKSQVAQSQSQANLLNAQIQNSNYSTLNNQNYYHSQQGKNNLSLNQFQISASNQGLAQMQHNQHRYLKSLNNRETGQGGMRVLMQHSNNKFKPLSIPIAVPKQLNGSQSVQSFGSKRSVTRIKLVGYSGDPEFQMIKDTSEKIMQANDGMLIVNTDEIDNEIDYDLKLKHLKRSSSAFLPAYKAFKSSNNIISNALPHNNNNVNNNNQAQPSANILQNQLISVNSASNFKRPYYFLTDKNEPLFSLKQLQEKYPLKHKAKEIIEMHEELQQNFGKQMFSRGNMGSSDNFMPSLQSIYPSLGEMGRLNQFNGNGNNHTNMPSYNSFTTLSSTQSTTRTVFSLHPSQNQIIDDMSEKKFVYLSIRTAQKFFARESSLSQPFFPFAGNEQQQNVSSKKGNEIPSLQLETKSSNENQLENLVLQNENSNNQNNQWTQNQTILYNNGEPFKIIIELYTKIAPKACENFIKLCEGFISNEGNYLTFRNTQALRIKKNGYIQMGYAKPGVSIYNGYFEDESFAIQHDKPGIIGYCNRGVPHSNSSQFYITLGEMKSFDKKMVAFGRVISGFKHLEKLNKMTLNTTSDIPPFSINICDSGVVVGRPSTNQSRKSTSSNISGIAIRSPKSGRNDPLQFGEIDHILDDDSYRVVRPDVFFYKGEKPTKLHTYEQYVIQEAEKHKEVAAVEYISLMLAFQSIALQCQELLTQSYAYNSIDDLRVEMKNTFVKLLSECQSVALLYDTKDDEVFIESNYGKFVVAFTSLDVDHLYDLNCCGSLFVIYRKTTTSFRPAKRTDLLQSGENIYGAGYIMYGQSTQIVFHTGHRLNGFTYDPEINLFVLTHPRIKASKRGGIISCDESVLHLSHENISKFIKRKKISKESYVCRYVGSRVADFHRTLLYGGILIFPQNNVNIFDAFTLSYIIDKAWDRSSCGQDGQVLIKKPNELTDQIQLYIGFSQDVLEIDNLYLSIRRKNSLYKIHEIPSSKTIKSSYSIHKSSINSPSKNQQPMLFQ